MAGLIIHSLAGLISALIVYKIFRRKDYSIIMFIGNLLPDLIGATYASIMVMSINPSIVLNSAPWISLEKGIFVQFFWILLQGLLIAFYLLLRIHIKQKQYKKHEKNSWILVKLARQHKEYEDMLALLIFGFITHMLMDMLIIEQCIWY